MNNVNNSWLLAFFTLNKSNLVANIQTSKTKVDFYHFQFLKLGIVNLNL